VRDTVMGEGGGKHSLLVGFTLFLATHAKPPIPACSRECFFDVIWKQRLLATVMGTRVYKADHRSDSVMTVLVMFL